MKTTPLPRRRLRCRAVRIRSSLTERPPAAHLEHCADCRAYFAAVNELESGLTGSAAQWSAKTPVPADLEGGILRAVASARGEMVGSRAEAPPAAAAVSGLAPLRRWSIAGGLVLAAAEGLAIMVSQREAQSPSSSVNPALAPHEVAALVDSAARLSDAWWNRVVPSAGTAIQNNPLQQEAASVYDAAQSALDFLALNFLPPGAAGDTPPPAGGPARNI